jgi:hypothetical protein
LLVPTEARVQCEPCEHEDGMDPAPCPLLNGF